MLSQYEDEIRSLEDEIRQLEERSRSRGPGPPADEPPPLAPLSAAELNAEHERLRAELAYFEELGGTELRECSRSSAGCEDPQSLSVYRLAGTCGALPFRLEFHLLHDTRGGRVVTDLSIALEAEPPPELRTFVSRMEERRSLLLFFRGVSAFAECCAHRRQTFALFKQRYPELIRLPEGSSAQHMVIANPDSSGGELIIVWKIHVSEEGAATPLLDLLTKIPKRALALDKRRVMERAPAAFRGLLKVYGVHTALEKLVKTFALLE
ncbi:centromere protein P [Pleurodeles waltl]|uniref:centromere protein P n=1 Tax=Pleurodeles waltl TaxID=8319 RepID=UPI00370955D9